jgi:hypothetical protein
VDLLGGVVGDEGDGVVLSNLIDSKSEKERKDISVRVIFGDIYFNIYSLLNYGFYVEF